MEIKDIVVEADMDVRGGAYAVNAIGGFAFGQSAVQTNGGYKSQSTGTTQSLDQVGIFEPVVNQTATADYSKDIKVSALLENINIRSFGW